MLVTENVLIALGAIRANKMRSILTTLGIIIGVAGVIGVVSIVQGLQHLITDRLQSVGTTYILIVPDTGQQGPGIVARQVKLTWDDGRAIQQEVGGVKYITPAIAGNLELKYRDRQHSPLVLGVNEDYPEVDNHTVELGRFLTRLDLIQRRKVAVVGTEVVDELNLGDEPLGKEIYVGNMPVTVVGVMEERGQSLGTNVDDLVFLPYDSALNLFGRHAGDLITLRLQAESAEVVDQVREGIETLLRRRHRIAEGQPDDFQVLVQDELLETFSSILGSVTMVVGGVVSIALIVGGIGIMNIMLVSVTERTREIGLRKAVGAKRQAILLQFLIEAITLSLVGGILGTAIGYGAGAAAVKLLPGNLPAVHVPLWAVGLAFGFCTVIGVAFGIYPASKAARLDPIDALRYE